MSAMHTAAMGMGAMQRQLDTTASNLANSQTTGHKAQRINFQDIFYQTLRRPGDPTSDAGTVSSGIQIGLGVKAAGTSRLMTEGTLQSTDTSTDVAIQGKGFFAIDLPDGRTGYTRDGSFQPDATGRLVDQNGYLVSGGITIPADARALTINAQGEVFVTLGADTNPTSIGQIQLANFVNPTGLEAIGNNLLLETAASGSAQLGTPGSPGFGTVLQGFLEGSNVKPITEITNMIETQRAYELMGKVITADDEMRQTDTRVT